MRTNKKIFLIVRFANKQSDIIIMAQAINKKINWYNVSDVFIFEVCVSRAFFGLQVPPVGFFYAI